eukprot:TRINITY_DN49377_c0_g1_i1.p1 TRINITY_DN49377_c0_g1~~TRINITY_DN49377_c0_g1_i1.p1  ORF type:complete len:562 (-),score=59.91 TRINITY_DN49377_c0_g1_i1:13-1698(-)
MKMTAAAMILMALPVCADLRHRVTNLAFDDEHEGRDMLAGDISWSPPDNVSNVLEYRIFVAHGMGNMYSYQLAAVPVGTNWAYLPAVDLRTWPITYPANFINVLTYRSDLLVVGCCPNGYQPVSEGASVGLYDNSTESPQFEVVENVQFVDEHDVAGSIRGRVSWEPMLGVSYAICSSFGVYLAADSAGSNETLLGKPTASEFRLGASEIHFEVPITTWPSSSGSMLVYCENENGRASAFASANFGDLTSTGTSSTTATDTRTSTTLSTSLTTYTSSSSTVTTHSTSSTRYTSSTIATTTRSTSTLTYESQTTVTPTHTTSTHTYTWQATATTTHSTSSTRYTSTATAATHYTSTFTYKSQTTVTATQSTSKSTSATLPARTTTSSSYSSATSASTHTTTAGTVESPTWAEAVKTLSSTTQELDFDSTNASVSLFSAMLGMMLNTTHSTSPTTVTTTQSTPESTSSTATATSTLSSTTVTYTATFLAPPLIGSQGHEDGSMAGSASLIAFLILVAALTGCACVACVCKGSLCPKKEIVEDSEVSASKAEKPFPDAAPFEEP